MTNALDHRVRVAGGTSIEHIMDEGARKALYLASRGVPREIIKIANASLLLGAVNSIRPITEELIKLSAENIMKSEQRDGAEETTELRAGAPA